MESLLDIPLSEIFSDDTFNCRSSVTPGSVLQLSYTLERDGLIQPIVVQPFQDASRPELRWKIICGHRRFAATKLVCGRLNNPAGTIKCRTMPKLTDERALILNLQENLERRELNILEEARTIERFKAWGWDAKRVADELGVYKKWVTVRYALLGLHPDIQAKAEAGFFTQGQIEDIAGFATEGERVEYAKKCIDHKLKPPEVKKRSKPKNPAAIGQTRSVAEMFAAQECVQDSMDDVKHPAAVALGYAAGAISLDDFYRAVSIWARAEGRELVLPSLTE